MVQATEKNNWFSATIWLISFLRAFASVKENVCPSLEKTSAFCPFGAWYKDSECTFSFVAEKEYQYLMPFKVYTKLIWPSSLHRKNCLVSKRAIVFYSKFNQHILSLLFTFFRVRLICGRLLLFLAFFHPFSIIFCRRPHMYIAVHPRFVVAQLEIVVAVALLTS